MFATLWNTLLFHPFLNVLMVFYKIFGENLGWAVIVMAIILRFIMIPATKKQTEMTRKMSGLKPKLEAIQKKYASNQKKLAEEQMKLYKETGYNPLGCLGNFLPQILVLYAIIQVINVVTVNNFDGLYPFIRDFVFGSVKDPSINMNFFMLDLSQTYSNVAKLLGNFSPTAIAYLLLALSVAVTQYFSTRFMQAMQTTTAVTKKRKKNEQMSPEEMQTQMMSSMNTIFPIMTGFITLSTPAVLGVYWLIQSIMFMIQYFFIDKDKSITAFKNLFKKSMK